MTQRRQRPLILGGSGRVGQMVARLWATGCWQADPLWQYRRDGTDFGPSAATVQWDMLQAGLPAVPPDLDAVIMLAGVTGTDPAALETNRALALAACDLAEELGGLRVLLASSQAVYEPRAGALNEDSPCCPVTPYGEAKLAMEHAVAERANVTCLRIGNVAGADGLLQAAAKGSVTLDRCAAGQGPRRAYIGPMALVQALAGLLAHPGPLPRVLNLAQPGLVAMDDLLRAADVAWEWGPVGSAGLPSLALDVTRLTQLVPLPTADAQGVVSQARLAGWAPV